MHAHCGGVRAHSKVGLLRFCNQLCLNYAVCVRINRRKCCRRAGFELHSTGYSTARKSATRGPNCQHRCHRLHAARPAAGPRLLGGLRACMHSICASVQSRQGTGRNAIMQSHCTTRLTERWEQPRQGVMDRLCRACHVAGWWHVHRGVGHPMRRPSTTCRSAKQELAPSCHALFRLRSEDPEPWDNRTASSKQFLTARQIPTDATQTLTYSLHYMASHDKDVQRRGRRCGPPLANGNRSPLAARWLCSRMTTSMLVPERELVPA